MQLGFADDDVATIAAVPTAAVDAAHGDLHRVGIVQPVVVTVMMMMMMVITVVVAIVMALRRLDDVMFGR